MTIIKKAVSSLVLFGLLVSSNVFADPHYYGHGGYAYRGHSDGGDWIVPALFGGLAVYALTQPRAAQPVYAPVVMAPPAPQIIQAQSMPPVWYYCQSSQTYYPYVQLCGEGWRVVPAVPGS